MIPRAEFSILACSDERICQLNAEFRGKSSPTNVLSWPSLSISELDEDRIQHLGDIAIAWETCSREAKLLKRTLDWHTAHLLIHGCLHILGYRHETDTCAQQMEEIEIKALEKIGFSSPY